VATEVADNALILDDTSGGAVVPLGDDEALAERVCRLLRNPTELHAAGAQARSAALERYSLIRWASAIGTLYEETWLRKTRRQPSFSRAS
jgi:glycosyltransferase involved in cell wall biosynthesis